MRGRIATRTRRFLVEFAVLSILAGCSSGATPVPTATATPVTAASPSAAHSPSATSTAYGPVAEVTGTATCPTTPQQTPTTGPGGVQQFRGGIFTCTVTTDDPRVSGTETQAPWNLDVWGTPDNAVGVQWGATRLENSVGAWVGTGSGAASTVPGDIIANWYKGTGAYAGLGYFALWTGTGPWTIRGLVFPGDPPNLAALPTLAPATPGPAESASPIASLPPLPSPIGYGPASVVTGTYAYTWADPGSMSGGPRGGTIYRDGVFGGVERVNDPRGSDTYTSTPWTIELWGGGFDTGAGIQWGPGLSVNAGGSWRCNDAGVYSADLADTIVGWCKGTDAYAGLAYFELLTSGDPFGMTVPAGADGSIHSLVFPGNPPTP